MYSKTRATTLCKLRQMGHGRELMDEFVRGLRHASNGCEGPRNAVCKARVRLTQETSTVWNCGGKRQMSPDRKTRQKAAAAERADYGKL